MTTIALSDIAAHHPDVLLPPDEEFVEEYAHAVRVGRTLAAERSVAFVAIARNAMPWLPRTLALVEETGSMFADWQCHIVENDSTDGTKQALLTNGIPRVSFEMRDNGRPHLSHTVSQERTMALAEYRTQCQEWVRSLRWTPDYVVVFDTDAWGGWSIDGVATSVYHMETDTSWYGLASYSWFEMDMGGRRFSGHYDAFALRWNHWRQRDQQWTHHWNPPVGSRPVELNSAFGQLAVYRYGEYVRGTYSGEDCEHVTYHRSVADACTRRFGLNPSSRCVAFWVPQDAGQHGDD